MKKTHRALLSILLVLALLATLPLTAMAENGDDNTNNDATLTGENGINYGTNVTLGETGAPVENNTLEKNTGTIQTNYGKVGENVFVGDNKNLSTPKPVITDNRGVVDKNIGGDRYQPVIENNYGTVKENSSGSMGKNREAGIVNNYNTVVENARNGVIENNKNGGIVQTNNGWVGYNNYSDGSKIDGVGNAGEVTDNYGLVFNDGGTVVNNYANASDGGPATVVNYSGTVENNSGRVESNGGTVENNFNFVRNLDGKVKTNNYDGVVVDYSGKENTVGTNYGVHEVYSSGNLSTPTAVYFGVHYENEQGEKVHLGQFKDGIDVKIEDLKNTREGYKITGIRTVEDYSWREKDFVDHNEGPVERADDGTGDTTGTTTLTSFKISAPTRLQLIWKKIASVFKPASTASSGGGGGAEVVELSARKRYIGLGSVIFINEKGYKVVELKDDAYVVVSFDALSDEDVKDLDALFAKLFTTEQQAQIKNVGQLLDAEDVLTVFGKPGNHPVFEVNKTLVE